MNSIEVPPISFIAYIKKRSQIGKIAIILLGVLIVPLLFMNTSILTKVFLMFFMFFVGGPFATRFWTPYFKIPYRISFSEDKIQFSFCFIMLIKWTKTFPIEKIDNIRFVSNTDDNNSYDKAFIFMDWFGLRSYKLNDIEGNWDHTSIEKVLTIAENYCKVIKVRNN